MGRGLRSVRYYVFFLALSLTTSMISISIYILSERRVQRIKISLSENNPEFNSLQDSLFFQKLGIAAKNSNLQSKLDSVNATRYPLVSKTSWVLDRNTSVKVEGRTEMLHEEKNDIEKAALLLNSGTVVNFKVHIFYYPWYGNPQTDGHYIHWNHHMLPHWNKDEAKKWPLGKHLPPGDIGANFYPELGPYSSSNASVVNTHMKQIRSAGVGVLVVSWYPPGEADHDGIPFDNLMPLILDSAYVYGIKVSFHLEPFKNRGGETLKTHVRYIIDTYGHHPGFYRTELKGQNLPVFYIYDSYQVHSSEWAAVLKPGAALTLRDTRYDGIFLGLYLSPEDEVKILDAGFDGFYTYFAANQFTKGSSWTNWKMMAEFAKNNNLLFVPSIGPGYVDTRIRPWNSQTERKRDHGNYFRRAFQAAIDAGAKYISITSFNEWHEGTQVEPAIPKETERFKYEDYQPNQPDFYLNLLKTLVDQFSEAQK